MATKGKSNDGKIAHAGTYEGFLKLLTYGVIVSAVSAALVLFLITR